jgi:RNA polymerase sigma-70 factor (ECF subfamily)
MRPGPGEGQREENALPRKSHGPCAQRHESQARTDQALVEGIRRQSEADFNVLYERYFQRVYGYTYSRLRNRADAEEVTQETFTAVFRSIDAYRGRSSLLSWIYGIAKNTANNHLRRARAHEQRLERAEQALQGDAGRSAATPEEQLSLRRCQDAIAERLSGVADWHAEVFVMRHLEDMPIGEIAQRVSRSNDAVRSSLYRVKRLLVEAVGNEGASAR